MRIVDLPIAHEHHVHAVVHVQTVGVVGIVFQQLVVLKGCSVVVLHLVLEDGTHVIESLLDNLVGLLDLLLGFRNLLEVVFLEVGVFGAFEGFNINLDGITVLVDDNAVGERHEGAVGFLVVE